MSNPLQKERIQMTPFRAEVVRSFVLRVLTLFPSLMFANMAHAERLDPGDRVRLEYPGGKLDGQLVSSHGDSVVIATSGSTPPSTIRKDSITHLERLDGQKRNWGRGALIGAAAGAVTGGIVMATDNSAGWGDSFAVGPCTLLGAAAGALVGGFIQTDRWTDVSHDEIRVGVTPSGRSGVALSLAWNF
jgi:hypothetical protein